MIGRQLEDAKRRSREQVLGFIWHLQPTTTNKAAWDLHAGGSRHTGSSAICRFVGIPGDRMHQPRGEATKKQAIWIPDQTLQGLQIKGERRVPGFEGARCREIGQKLLEGA